MNRRQVLALLGSAAVGGCVGSGGPEDGTTGYTTTETTTATTTKMARSTTSDTTTAELPELGEPLPSECPVADGDVQRVVCDLDTDAPMEMRPSADNVSLPTDPISFTLSNETDSTFETNYYDWSLHKRVDGGWYHVAPGEVPLPAHRLPPGESHTWLMTIDNSKLDEEIISISDTSELHLRGLGGGTYAFGIDGWFENQEYTDAIAFVARFDIEAERISLSLTDSVASVEREDKTAVVRMPESENPQRVVVTRVSDPSSEPERVVAEQVIRTTPLRNALATFEEDVQRVEVENATLMLNFPLSLERSYVEYRGTAYEIEVKRPETTN